jgi:hypothetical protein
MIFGEPNPIPMWPPIPGLLDSAFSSLDFSRQNEWGIDEWRSYAKFLEEKGQQAIDILENNLGLTRASLYMQQRKASRRKRTKYDSIIDALVYQSYLKPKVLRLPSEDVNVNLPQKGGLLSSLPANTPVSTMQKKQRGRKKNENLQSVEYARLVLQKRDELEAMGQTVTDEQALEAICEELSLPRMQKQLVISRKKTIFNRLPQLRQSR